MRHRITFFIAHNLRTVRRIACIPLGAVLLLSIVTCCALPLRQESSADPGKAQGEANARDRKPQYGDLKIVDGVEYIYGKNVRWPTMPMEPEYVWVRKDQYASRAFDSLLDALSERSDDKKEIEELTGRIERLEREIKRLDDAPGAPGQR
jgi:uncharacterized protein YpmB